MGVSTAPRMVPLREVAMEFGSAWHYWKDLRMGFGLEVDLVLEKEMSLGRCLGTGMGVSTAPRMVPLREVAMEFGSAWHY